MDLWAHPKFFANKLNSRRFTAEYSCSLFKKNVERNSIKKSKEGHVCFIYFVDNGGGHKCSTSGKCPAKKTFR
jgi:hypothetical protein